MTTSTKKTRYNNGKLYIKKTITTKTAQGEVFKIKITLDDDCNNGHNDFAITGEIYRNGRIESCGCLHDEILKVKPSLRLFVDLHLSDENGIPMYAVESGYYFYCGNIKHFAEHCRIDIDTAKELKDKKFTKVEFTAWIATQYPRYKKEADAAKKILEDMP